jgi:hypothetical protein
MTVLRGDQQRLLLNCCRQAGKSTAVALHALVEAIFSDNLLVLLVLRSYRQSQELFRILTGFFDRLEAPLKKRQTSDELLLANDSRIVCLPCREETIRGYSNVGLLIIDEAARVPDDLYRAVRPMLAVSNGRMICLSTPYGKRGFFHDAWATGGDDWQRIEVPAERISRITPEFSPRSAVPSAAPGSARNINARSKRSKGSSIPICAAASCRDRCRRGASASAASTSASATPLPPSGASSIATVSSGSTANTIRAKSR